MDNRAVLQPLENTPWTPPSAQWNVQPCYSSILRQKGLNYTNISTYHTIPTRKVKLLIKDVSPINMQQQKVPDASSHNIIAFSDWSSFLYHDCPFVVNSRLRSKANVTSLRNTKMIYYICQLSLNICTTLGFSTWELDSAISETIHLKCAVQLYDFLPARTAY